MIRGATNVVELDGSRLTAFSATVTSGAVEVRRWISCQRPDSISGDDAVAVGAWVGEELRRGGLPKAKVVLAVSRGDVVLKTLSFPAGAGATGAEIAGMVKLAMQRQLTMSMEGTAIDYAPLGVPVKEASGAEVIPVIAGAMPADRVAWCRNMAAAAGVKLRRIGLRCFGAAALLAEISQRRTGPVLGIAVGWGSTEFVVVEDGRMVFARASDTPRPMMHSEVEGFVERVAVEAKRTWMSHRASRTVPELEMVAVLGEGELATRVGERCSKELESPWQLIGAPAIVKLPDAMPESERSATAPLVGLLAEEALKRPVLDFANPKKLPDVKARRRQLVLLGLFGAIVVGGGSYVFAQLRLERAETRLRLAQEEATKSVREYERYLLLHARAAHLREWTATRADWLAHLNVLNEQAPDPRRMLIDDVTASLDAEINYTPPRQTDRRYPDGEWGSRRAVKFNLDGRAQQYQTAVDFRARLLASRIYTVDTGGPENPEKLSLILTTDTLRPDPASVATNRDAANGAPSPPETKEAQPAPTATSAPPGRAQSRPAPRDASKGGK